MTIDMEYYRKINGLYGTTGKKDFLQKQAIKSVNKTNDSMLSTFEILINSNYAENIVIDGISVKCIFDYSKTTQDTKTELASYMKEMWIKVGLVDVGSIIKHVDKVSLIENTYFVISKQEDLDGYDVCYIQKSNNTLLFYSNESSFLNEIPCIVGNVSIGNSETKYITTVDNELPLTVPDNEITRQIAINEIYKIGTYSYQISSVFDDISIPGLLQFKMKYSETDQVLPTFTLQILNGEFLSTDTITPIQLNVQVLKDSIVLSPTPDLIFESSDVLVATVDVNGLVTPLTIGSVMVSAKLASDNTIYDSISIDVVEVPQNNFTVIIDSGAPSIIKNYTETYTCVFKNNGLQIVDTSIFYLTADDGISETILAQIVSQDSVGNSCVVKGLGLGYVKLFVKNSEGTVVSDGFRIKVESLF